MIDEIAGPIRPAVNGACDYFGADGHSGICLHCDHPLMSHAHEAWPEAWRSPPSPSHRTSLTQK